MPLMPIAKMARVVTKSLLGGSACKMYPKREPVFYDNTRGQLEIDTSGCVLCGLCAKKCPGDAIEVDREKKTWQIDLMKCINCGVCVDSCPKKCLKLLNAYTPPTTGETKRLFHVEPKKTSAAPHQ